MTAPTRTIASAGGPWRSQFLSIRSNIAAGTNPSQFVRSLLTIRT